MRSGEVVIAKYKEHRKGKSIITFDKGTIRLSDIRAINYYKPLPHELNHEEA